MSRLDLLPSRLLEDRVPRSFVADYVHWYDHDSGSVQFRPRKNPWEADYWRLIPTNSSWCLVNGSYTLLDITSRYTCKMSQIFRPLEDPCHIHILLDAESQAIEIRLPRLKLEFYVSPNDIEIKSRQYRGMIIDTNQQIGTLVGLSSKLVLRHTDQQRNRLVLIPEGNARYRKVLREHVFVSIDRQAMMRVHAYSIDEVLGRLLDTCDFQSKLFLCYLHALTSHCLPDDLTGHTGTEAALIILNSAAVRSFHTLSDQNIRLLKVVAELSPSRTFYPANLRVMQQIEWDRNLPTLSQHSGLRYAVDQILHQIKKMSLFHPADKCTASALEDAIRSSSGMSSRSP
jgi:hypothetical protein